MDSLKALVREPRELVEYVRHELQHELLAYVWPDSREVSRNAAAERVLLILEGMARKLGLLREACGCGSSADVKFANGIHCEECGHRTEGDIVRMFGSFSNGFQTGTSDMDVVLLTSHACDQVAALAKFRDEMKSNVFFDNITQVFGANVPLLKLSDSKSSIEIDFCVNNDLGIRNSELLFSYGLCDVRMLQLGRLVKAWAKHHDLVGSADGYLNSYTHMLLVVYFLQVLEEPVVPNLQMFATESHPVAVADTKRGCNYWCEAKFWPVSDASMPPLPPSNNEQSLVELLLRFFKFYSSKFDWHSHAVSIRLGLPGKFVDKFTLEAPTSREQWYVEDPFDLRQNLAGRCSVEGRRRIVAQMETTYKFLTRGGTWANFCREDTVDTQQTCYMKCRASPRVTPNKLVEVFQGCQLLRVWYPTPRPDRNGYMQVFFEFATEAGRRRGHSKNELALPDGFTLQLHYTTIFVLKEARRLAPLVETLTAEGKACDLFGGFGSLGVRPWAAIIPARVGRLPPRGSIEYMQLLEQLRQLQRFVAACESFGGFQGRQLERLIAATQRWGLKGGKDCGKGGKDFGGKDYGGKGYDGKDSGGFGAI